MLEITNLRQGAILNHNHGKETAGSLTTRVEGLSDMPGPVTVNGLPAVSDGRRFFADIELTKKINDISATAHTAFGDFSQSLKVVWDKKSFRRCNFYIDDHSFFWTDLIKERPRHAFDHHYLGGLKRIHDRFGLKVTLNCFYHNDHHACDMNAMPDVYKQEFIDNSDWLKLSVHSRSEFPDRPYIESSVEEFARDYDTIHDEICRFAGEESFIAPVVIHWGIISPAAAKTLLDRGVRAYSAAFRPRIMGGPSAADRAAGAKTGNIAASQVSKTVTREQIAGQLGFGFAEHYNAIEEQSYLSRHRALYNPFFDLVFFIGNCCCNLVPLDMIPQRYADAVALARETGNEFFSAASHEQYSFPYYHNYIPDHMERIERATRCMIEECGCTPVFYSQGFMGNTSWE